MAYDTEKQTAKKVRKLLRQTMRSAHIEWLCALCRSTDLRFEDAPTVFKTLEEATPILREEERKNLESRLYILAMQKLAQRS